MATLIVPPLDLSYPTLGPAIADFIEERCVYGPGSLAGLPAVVDPEFRGQLYRMYEVYPQGHRLEGRRRFTRAAIEVRKGLAKTEKAAWISFCELHPEAPVRCDGFDADGNPVGRPVNFPYIPMMAHTQEQVAELAYGVLKYVVENGPDSHMFDASLERIIRLGPRGEADGKAVPVANSPGSRDGALTTFQHADEPHRLYLPTHKHAIETMSANLSKRGIEDPWFLFTGTAGQPGQGSVQEDVRAEAEAIAAGEIDNPRLFFFARWAGDEFPVDTFEERVAAVADATGPAGEWSPGNFENIAAQWDRPRVDKAFLERVWLNRWRRSNSMAFDLVKVRELAAPGERIPAGAFVTLGFDGARFRDATGIVATDIATGRQELLGGWERPLESDDWEVDEGEVTAVIEDAMDRFEVWRLYADPPHWTETIGSWSVRWPERVEEWWTARPKTMAYTLREYVEAIDAKSITFGGTSDAHDDLMRHIGNAGRKDLRLKDDEGEPLWVLQKQDGKQEVKFDYAMASVLSWKACADARKSGARPRGKHAGPRRIY